MANFSSLQSSARTVFFFFFFGRPTLSRLFCMWYTLITCPTDPLSDGPTVLVTLRGFVRARSRQAGISFKRLSAFSVTPWHGNTLGSLRGEFRNPLEVVYHTCECCRCKCRLVFIHLMPFFFNLTCQCKCQSLHSHKFE